MRTTVSLDPDVEAAIRQLMEQRGISFKRALNDAVRAGSAPAANTTGSFTTPRKMGAPLADIEHALRLAADDEDSELVRKLQVRK